MGYFNYEVKTILYVNCELAARKIFTLDHEVSIIIHESPCLCFLHVVNIQFRNMIMKSSANKKNK